MRVATASLLRLHAVVPAGEAATATGLCAIACGAIAGLAGKVRGEPPRRAALRHDRVVGRALAACSSVVPFRLGTDAPSAAALRATLAANEPALAHQLARFAGRVEMGLRVKLPSLAALEALRAGLAPIRALAPGLDDRRERLMSGAAGQVFEGCYLVSRGDIAAYWSGVREVRAALRGAPLVGSGPWAAYSFCDLVLRPEVGRNATGRAPPSSREVTTCIRSGPSKRISMWSRARSA